MRCENFRRLSDCGKTLVEGWVEQVHVFGFHGQIPGTSGNSAVL
jgi:hypothetical protein